MALEAGTYIDDLNSSNPPQSDSLTQAAGHLRLIKSTILATFPNVAGEVTGTHTTINAAVDGFAAAQFLPAGTIVAFGGASLPTGYLWCDGTSYLRTDYAALFTAISTTWGAADGTHFSVPNFKDRFLVGRATMGATTDAAIIDSLLTSTTLGATYDGEGAIDTITLTTTELPAHTHTVGSITATFGSGVAASGGVDHTHTGYTSSNGSHSHTYDRPSNDTTRSSSGSTHIWQADYDDDTTSSDGAHTHTIQTYGASAYAHTHTVTGTNTMSGTSASAGSGTAFTVAILPPCAVVNYIIKT